MRVSTVFVVLALLGLSAFAPVVQSRLTGGVQCLNEAGSPVDWWFVYKMPNGFQYSYWDSKMTSGSLTISDESLDCTTGCALGNTLHQLYSAKSSLAHLLYNDEPLGDNSQTSSGPNGGHVKGVLTADSNGGFWLIHSVPKFPDLGPSKFTWTASTIYGQSFICISLDEDGVEDASNELQYQDPNIYDSAIPKSLQSTFPKMNALLGGTRQSGSSVVSITSSGGTKFTSFSKDNNWGKDLYDDLVEPTLKYPFQWETWRRSPFLPSLCSTQYDTLNVASISVGDVQFSYTQDHSKWGVSMKGSWSCVGGINRMQSQRNRGGGTICVSNAPFWKALSGVVASTEPCSTKAGNPKSGGKGKAAGKKMPKPVRAEREEDSQDQDDTENANDDASVPQPQPVEHHRDHQRHGWWRHHKQERHEKGSHKHHHKDHEHGPKPKQWGPKQWGPKPKQWGPPKKGQHQPWGPKQWGPKWGPKQWGHDDNNNQHHWNPQNHKGPQRVQWGPKKGPGAQSVPKHGFLQRVQNNAKGGGEQWAEENQHLSDDISFSPFKGMPMPVMRNHN